MIRDLREGIIQIHQNRLEPEDDICRVHGFRPIAQAGIHRGAEQGMRVSGLGRGKELQLFPDNQGDGEIHRADGRLR